MKIVSNIIKYILLIVLSISIILTVAINTITSTILNKEYILGKLEETNYYQKIYNQVESNFENYIYQSGLDENVIKNIVTEEDIKTDTIQIISNIYEAKNTQIDINKIKNRLENNIYNSLSGQKISDSTKKSINQFIDQIVEEYKDTIVHTKYERNINEILTKVINYSSIIKKALIRLDIVLIIILLILNIKDILRGIALIGISLSSTGIFYVLSRIIINSKVKIDNITILNDSFSITLRNIIDSVINSAIINSIVLFMIGIIFIAVSNIIKYKNKKDEKLN